MAELMNLWLPIIACAAAVWIASFICWALSPHHKPDWRRFDKESELLDVCRGASPGQYIFPYVEPADFKDAEKKSAYEAGPHGTLNVWSGPPVMARNMVLTFATFVVVSLFIGYLASLALAPGADWMAVFRFTGTAGILAWCFASTPNDIWFGTPKRAMLTNLADGIAYGIVTGVVFASLWPGA